MPGIEKIVAHIHVDFRFADFGGGLPGIVVNYAMNARILAIDYGLKRTGLAVTDPLQIIATGLCTVETPKLMAYLKEYLKKEPVELILIGEPKNLDDSDTHITAAVRKFMVRLQKEFPSVPLKAVDERYSSKMATRAMIDMGLKKKQRRNKALVDEIAATMLLQEWLAARGNLL